MLSLAVKLRYCHFSLKSDPVCGFSPAGISQDCCEAVVMHLNHRLNTYVCVCVCRCVCMCVYVGMCVYLLTLLVTSSARSKYLPSRA